MSSRTETRSALRVAVSGIVGLLRHSVFFVLLTLRPLVLLASRILAPACLIGGLIYGGLRGWTSLPCLLLLAASFAITLVSFLYDLVLARVGPSGLDLYS